MPLTIFAYRDSLLDYFSESPIRETLKADFTVRLMDINEEQTLLLKSDSFWEQLFAGNPELNNNIRINLYSSTSYSSFIYYNGTVLSSAIAFTMPDDAGSVFCSEIPLDKIIGNPLSTSDPTGVLISYKLLDGKNPKDALGKEIYINDRIYTIRGIIKEDTKQIHINMISQTEVKNYNHMTVKGYLINGHKDQDKIYELAALLREELLPYFYVQVTENKFVLDKIAESGIKKEADSLLLMSIGGLLFCICSSLGIMNAFVSDNEKNIRIKMEMGAGKMVVFFEFFIFIFIINLFSSVIAYILFFPVKRYMAMFFLEQLLISYRIFILLFIVSLFTSISVALFSIIRVGRRLP